MRHHASVAEGETRKKTFGNAARRARERAGFAKRPAFARATGLSVRTIAAVELGEEGAGGRESRGQIAEALGFDLDEVEDYIEGKTDTVPAPAGVPSRTARLDLQWILTAPRGAVVDVSKLVEEVSGAAVAEKFLLDALELRRRHNDESGGIEPREDAGRDVS